MHWQPVATLCCCWFQILKANVCSVLLAPCHPFQLTGAIPCLENEAIKEAIKEDCPVQLGSYNMVLVMRIVEF